MGGNQLPEAQLIDAEVQKLINMFGKDKRKCEAWLEQCAYELNELCKEGKLTIPQRAKKKDLLNSIKDRYIKRLRDV
jgi:hypothetical protein